MKSTQLTWMPDILGPGFSSVHLDLGPDPDGEGTAFATLVAYGVDEPGFAQRPALLWIHGMTDYFFSAHVARHYHELGYAFYAVDLRKCGRSRQEGQTWHYVSDLRYYFADLNFALEMLPNQQVIPIAHSTGGLIAALWLDAHRPEKVSGLILNGPWLDMMSVPRPIYRALVPIINVVGKRWPKLPFPSSGNTAYGESIHRDHHGEWDFDTTLKPLGGFPKYMGWLRAIVNGFAHLHSGTVNVGVPYLTVCSTRSKLGTCYSDALNYVDAIVDVNQTIKWAPTLGDECTLRPVSGARHEAFSSVEPVRNRVFAITDAWLERTQN